MIANSLHGQGDHGKKDGLDPERQETDHQGQEQTEDDGDAKPKGQIHIRRGSRYADEKADAVGPDAEKHGMAEGKNPSVAQHDVKTRHKDGEDAIFTAKPMAL